MATIKAPFNFVPLSDQVFFPDWANQISQDIPFKDGISGTIELKITAKSPIFVRNGHTRQDADDKSDEYKSFSKTPDGKYFIPATSIKGAVRNVLEIMSFGKINLDKKAMFAQREWGNEQLYPLKKEQAKFHCGYLRRKGNTYEIIDCGKPYRIGHDRIDEYLGSDILKKHFSQQQGIDLTKEQKYNGKVFDPKTAAFKYALTSDYNLEELKFSLDEDRNNEYKDNRLIVSNSGEIEGDIVFTGQPDKWVYPRPTQLRSNAGKFYEFVFPKPQTNSKTYEISEVTFDHFKFIYSESTEWVRAKTLLDKKGIPVFFRTSPGKIKDFGLAFLYKLPYDKSPYETLSDDHKKSEPDLAECLFGYIPKNNSNDNSLRGRIQFSNAFSDNAEQDTDVRLSLGSPKASYYPIYIIQDGKNGKTTQYATYNNGKISGWKRYPVRANTWTQATGSDKIDTIIYPLKSGAQFTGTIHFHNLRPIELGALLSALTFHGDKDCFYQFGQAKPFGFGKSKLEIEIKDNEIDANYFMALFEGEMKNRVVVDWCNNQSIRELFTMAHSEVSADSVLFAYMNMNNNPNENDFLNAKDLKEYLQLYSKLSNATYQPESLYDKFKDKIEADKKQHEQEEQEKKKSFNDLMAEANLLFADKKYEEAKAKYKEANDMGIEDLSYKINECDDEIQKIATLSNSNIEDVVKCSSIAAFAGGMKKWVDIPDHHITENDCLKLGNILRSEVQKMNNSKKKEWSDFSKWSKIKESVGEGSAQKIFDAFAKE